VDLCVRQEVNVKLIAIVGSAVRSGKTRKAVECAVKAATAFERTLVTEIVDLGQYRVSILDGRPVSEYEDDTSTVLEIIKSGTMFLIASPIYRGTYTGALKNLLDHISLEVFEGKVVGLVATGASPHHYLAIDHQFRGVLAWFNAYVLPGSVYLENTAYTDGEIVDESALADLHGLGRSLVSVSKALGDVPAKPDCLTRQMMGARRV